MADKKKDHSVPTSPPVASETTPTPEVKSGNGNTGTAMIKAPEALISVAEAKDSALTIIRGLFDKYQGEAREDLLKLVESINPDKEGLEEMDAGFVVPVIRIVHGTTREPPAGSGRGDLFTNFGSKLPKPFKCFPLYGFKMNRMFPSKDEALGRPICTAPDAVFGKPFGKCLECDNLPLNLNTTGKPTDCDNVIVFLVMSEQFRVYRVEFAKTSRSAGQKLDHMIRESAKIWDRWVSINTSETKGDKANYHVFTVSCDGQETPMHLREAASAFLKFIVAERKMSLRQHYASALAGSKKNTDENVDMEGLTGGGGDTNPDLSTGGV